MIMGTYFEWRPTHETENLVVGSVATTKPLSYASAIARGRKAMKLGERVRQPQTAFQFGRVLSGLFVVVKTSDLRAVTDTATQKLPAAINYFISEKTS
jgi:hypothetical protein